MAMAMKALCSLVEGLLHLDPRERESARACDALICRVTLASAGRAARDQTALVAGAPPHGPWGRKSSTSLAS
eukprot:CAMPEP_0119429552 /NCGR_PEP_ID=MMETSP1335-20130426/42419_1 /TAXON_ID=259385 /ORGANISM="Chrysoculter rhomboideus, Strain RCC1486" /LENGTH=71 /DNA_ID=CAMNT_0007455271 /DNA_START=75 /DNA_END=290 /DNA_ORIENTATION=-